jgi:hypothetical protein
MWRLLRIWHVEVLSTVAHRSDAYTFKRTSYCVAPEGWQALGRDEIDARVCVLLTASYAKRNHIMAQSGDPAEMWLVAYDHEWVSREPMDPIPSREVDGMVVNNEAISDDLKKKACLGWLSEVCRDPRPGVAARPWYSAFSAFRVDEGGQAWHLLKPGESEDVFDELLIRSVVAE